MRKRDYLVYVAGPYSGDTENNVTAAAKYAKTIWELGFTAICPHLNCHGFEHSPKLTYEDFLEGDFVILKRCDAIFLMPNYKESKGAVLEQSFASIHGIRQFYNLEQLETFAATFEVKEIPVTHGKISHYKIGVAIETDSADR